MIFLISIGAVLMGLLVGVPVMHSWMIRRRAKYFGWITIEQRTYRVATSNQIGTIVLVLAPAAFFLGVSIWHYLELPTFPIIEAPIFIFFAVIGYLAIRKMRRYALVVDSDAICIHRPDRINRLELCDLVTVDCARGCLLFFLRSGELHSVSTVFESVDKIFAGLLLRVVENATFRE
jgi:hypothetical protein